MCYETDTQYANFRGKPLCQATKRHKNNSYKVKNEKKMRGTYLLFACSVIGRLFNNLPSTDQANNSSKQQQQQQQEEEEEEEEEDKNNLPSTEQASNSLTKKKISFSLIFHRF